MLDLDVYGADRDGSVNGKAAKEKAADEDKTLGYATPRVVWIVCKLKAMMDAYPSKFGGVGAAAGGSGASASGGVALPASRSGKKEKDAGLAELKVSTNDFERATRLLVRGVCDLSLFISDVCTKGIVRLFALSMDPVNLSG